MLNHAIVSVETHVLQDGGLKAPTKGQQIGTDPRELVGVSSLFGKPSFKQKLMLMLMMTITMKMAMKIANDESRERCLRAQLELSRPQPRRSCCCSRTEACNSRALFSAPGLGVTNRLQHSRAWKFLPDVETGMTTCMISHGIETRTNTLNALKPMCPLVPQQPPSRLQRD